MIMFYVLICCGIKRKYVESKEIPKDYHENFKEYIEKTEKMSETKELKSYYNKIKNVETLISENQLENFYKEELKFFLSMKNLYDIVKKHQNDINELEKDYEDFLNEFSSYYYSIRTQNDQKVYSHIETRSLPSRRPKMLIESAIIVQKDRTFIDFMTIIRNIKDKVKTKISEDDSKFRDINNLEDIIREDAFYLEYAKLKDEKFMRMLYTLRERLRCVFKNI